MKKHLMNLIRNEDGVTALEYGLIAALIAGVIVVGVTTLGTNILAKFNELAGNI